MEGEKTQRWEDHYMESATIEHEFDYPERKDVRKRDKQILEQSYPDNESRYKGALSYLSGDFVQVFLKLTPPAPEKGEEGWQFIYPIDTVEEHYSQHPRYPLFVPILLKAAPEEVLEQNHLVRRMNEAIKQRNAEEINRIREEAIAFRESILKKSAEIGEKK